VNGLYSLACIRIDNFYGVVAERRNEQPLSFYVDGHVVDSTLHVW